METYITYILIQKASKGQSRAKENRNKQLVKIISETYSNRIYKALSSLVKYNVDKEQIYEEMRKIL